MKAFILTIALGFGLTSCISGPMGRGATHVNVQPHKHKHGRNVGFRDHDPRFGVQRPHHPNHARR